MPRRRQHLKQRLFVVWLAGLCVFAIWARWPRAARAAAAPPSAELRIVGPGPEATRIQQVLERLLVEQGVRMHFSVTRDISIKEVLKPPADATSIIARIFVDLREPDAMPARALLRKWLVW